MSKKKRKHYFREKLPTRPCPITIAGIEEIDYKDVELLKMFITGKGKIIPRRISGLNARSQKKITRAIKKARNTALLSFAEGYIKQDEIQD
ncbi:30S ribosomal protein S18 [bacterium]|nr:30S ribosomal protein S18 [bacterium]